jgi:hypothetical protein
MKGAVDQPKYTLQCLSPDVWAEILKEKRASELLKCFRYVSKEMREIIDKGPVFPRLRKHMFTSKRDVLWNFLMKLEKHRKYHSPFVEEEEDPENPSLGEPFLIIWDLLLNFEDHVNLLDKLTSGDGDIFAQQNIPKFHYRFDVSTQQLLHETFLLIGNAFEVDALIHDDEAVSIEIATENNVKGYKLSWKSLFLDGEMKLDISIVWYFDNPFEYNFIAVLTTILTRRQDTVSNFKYDKDRICLEIIDFVKMVLRMGFKPIHTCKCCSTETIEWCSSKKK